MNNDSPSTHGGNGQDNRGRFIHGNKLGRGNPLAGRAAKIRAKLLDRFTEEHQEIVARQLIGMAGGGDLAAIKELYDRTSGKAAQTEILERIEALERLFEAKDEAGNE